MDKKDLIIEQLRKDVRYLQRIADHLLRRVSVLEKQTRSVRAGVHAGGLSVGSLSRRIDRLPKG